MRRSRAAPEPARISTGRDAVQTHMTNSRLTDPEILETRFPVILERFAIRRGSGGAGAHRGGDGVERRIRFREPMHAAILSNRRRVAPRGIAGGGDAQPGVNKVVRADGARGDSDGDRCGGHGGRRRLRDRDAGGGGYGEGSYASAADGEGTPARRWRGRSALHARVSWAVSAPHDACPGSIRLPAGRIKMLPNISSSPAS